MISIKYTEYLHRRNGQIRRRGYIPTSKRSRHIPKYIKAAVFRRDNGKCVKCGLNVAIQYDHIIPFARGGKHTVDNLQLLCANCNSLKSDRI